MVVNDANVRVGGTRGAWDFPLLQFDYGVRGRAGYMYMDDPLDDRVVPLPHQSRTSKSSI